jgi:hypothetical protein
MCVDCKQGETRDYQTALKRYFEEIQTDQTFDSNY